MIEASNITRVFPRDFQWGVATAAYQVEGAAQEDGRGPSIWDTFSRIPGRIVNGDTGNVACDHYHRMTDDVALLSSLGVSHYRFSIGWPRVLPTGRVTPVNQKGLDFYHRLVDALLDHGVNPVITLYHWDLPEALQQHGGWLNRDTSQAFAEYAGLMVETLGDRVKRWITHNEPWCTAVLGHMTGQHAPGIQEPGAALTVAHHVLLSHGLAAQAMRAVSHDLSVGITLNLSTVYGQDNSELTERAVSLQDAFANRWYLDPLFYGRYPDALESIFGQMPEVEPKDMAVIRQPLDFLGVNYYSSQIVTANSQNPHGWPVTHVTPEALVTDMGWPVMPHGLTDLLVRLSHDYGPIPLVITENGAAYPDILQGGKVVDTDRIQYLESHINAVADALKHGADIRGYYVWSLMDNYEWAYGYTKRFGIVYVDFDTQERILKQSAHWYREFLSEVTRLE